MSLLCYDVASFMNFTGYSTFHIINQVTKTPRNVMLELKIIITERLQSLQRRTVFFFLFFLTKMLKTIILINL